MASMRQRHCFRGIRCRFVCVWVCSTKTSIASNPRTVETAMRQFTLCFVRSSLSQTGSTLADEVSPGLARMVRSLHSDVVRVNIESCVASKLSKLWRNDS